ncbi:MAG TPA: hypothetical protein VN364_04915 [Bellilinea sp.]|nr:hypothetical protein [Bellilinea sp.]
MNEQFLYGLQKSPRPEFSAALLNEINTHHSVENNHRYIGVSPWTIGLASVFLILTLTFAFVPSAQALAVEFLQKIGIVTFEEKDQINISRAPNAKGAITITEQEARDFFVLPFTLPMWVPEGFEVNPVFFRVDAPIEELPPVVRSQWHGDRGYIDLTIVPNDKKWEDRYKDRPENVGPGSVEEVDINGSPAALISGGWTADKIPEVGETLTYSWSSEPGRGSILWVQDDLLYTINWTYLPDTQDPIQNDEIIQMARSIP